MSDIKNQICNVSKYYCLFGFTVKLKFLFGSSPIYQTHSKLLNVINWHTKSDFFISVVRSSYENTHFSIEYTIWLLFICKIKTILFRRVIAILIIIILHTYILISCIASPSHHAILANTKLPKVAKSRSTLCFDRSTYIITFCLLNNQYVLIYKLQLEILQSLISYTF